MQTRSVLAALIAMACVSIFPAPGTARKGGVPAHRPPHIVLVIADDLGWGDVGYHGGDLPTPEIDALAAEGVQLGSFYTQPLCTPTRAALLTGRYPMRYGLQNGVIEPWTFWGLPLEERTLPQALREAGYFTALIGKWHLGAHARSYLPLARGFDHHYGSYHGAFDDQFTRTRMGALDWHRNGMPVWEEGYSTDLLADEAVDLIGTHDPERPLFMMVSFTVPHAPLQAPARCIDRTPIPIFPALREGKAMVVCLDEAVGRIVSALRRQGMWEDTFFLFFSDHGAAQLGISTNAPLRGGKGQLLEGGIRVPAILSWPRRLDRIASYDHLLHVVDVYPTLLEIAGADQDQDRPVDGTSAWPALRHDRPVRTEALLNVVNDTGGIRIANWKLIRGPQDSRLYSIEDDPYEARDLAASLPFMVEWLSERLDFYVRQQAPPRPRLLIPPPGFVVPDVWEPVE